jgi:hypothetical protein
MFKWGHDVSYKVLDRGIIEVFGPTGITYLIKNATVYLSSLQSGYIYNYAFTIFLATTLFLMFIGNISFSLLQIQVLLLSMTFVVIFNINQLSVDYNGSTSNTISK